MDIVRTYVGCQMYARHTHMPASKMKTIPLAWPFAIWGHDMVGPLRVDEVHMERLKEVLSA